MVKASFARLSPLAKGRIVGMRQAGMKREDIRKKVRKKASVHVFELWMEC